MKSDLDSVFTKIDSKLNKLGLTTDTTKVKPCHEKFLVNYEKNSIILNEKEINDECNYIASIHRILNFLNPNKELYFINLADFTPAVILFYLQIISQNHKVFLFCEDVEQLSEYSGKNFKILDVDKALEFNLLSKKEL